MEVERRHETVAINHPDRRGAPRRCPRCGSRMRFALRVPVLNSDAAARDSSDANDIDDKLHFESAWLCQAADCAYRDVVVEDPG